MSKIATGGGTRMGGIIIDQRRTDDILGIAFQDARSAAPNSSDDYVLYRRGSSLYFWNGSSETEIGGIGAGGIPAWESIFASDATFTITPDTVFTIAGNRSTATGVVLLTNAAGGSGAVLSFDNAGSGVDILGTSSTWQVTKAGVATFAGISISGTSTAIVSTDDAVWTLKDNDATALSIGASGATTMLVFDTRNSAEVLGVTAVTFAVTANTTLTGASNTIASATVTNNTATTLGSSAAIGVVELVSTSLTTGTLLHLELTEGTLNGGHYLKAWDATGGAAVFSIGEDGNTTIAGAGGSNMFTITAGDAVMSDGSLLITDADNAVSFAVVNNTATTIGAAASDGVAEIVSTSLTTGALLNLQLTEGTLNGGWYIRAWDATAGAGVFSVGEDGLTTITGAGGSNMFVITAGDMLMSDGSITLVDADNAATVSVTNNTATTIGAAASGGVVTLISTSLTTGALLNLQLTEGTLNGGWYIRAWDATAGAAVFSVGEDGAVIAGTMKYLDFTEVVTATNVITAAESGSVFFLASATEFVSTLPAPAAGLRFTFIVSAAPSGASYTIVTHDGSDLIHGVASSAADAGGSVDTTAGTAADTITFVDGQALKGDLVHLWCDGTSWYAMGMCSDEDAITFTQT